MELSKKPIRNPVVVFQEGADDWAVLVNMDTAGSLALNSTGIIVWNLIDGKRTVEEIVAAARDHFRDAPDTIIDDITGLLGTLTEDGFVGYEVVNTTSL